MSLALVRSAPGEIVSDLVIESGVPMPDAGKIRRRYPWREMKVGQSIFVPAHETRPSTVVANASAYHRQHPGWKYQSRIVFRGQVRGVRVWRTA